MEFSLSEEQEAIFDVAYSFGQENIALCYPVGKSRNNS